MSARSESLGLAIAAGAVIVGLLLFVSVRTDERKRAAAQDKEQNQAALREAEQVPTLASSEVVPESSQTKRAASRMPSLKGNSVKPRVAAENSTEALEPLPGLAVGTETLSKEGPAPGLPAGEANGIGGGTPEARLAGEALDPAGKDAPTTSGADEFAIGGDSESGETSADGDADNTEDADDTEDSDDPKDAEVAPEDAETDSARLGSAEAARLPKPGSPEELSVMRDVQKHLKTLHSLLLRTDIPPAAREAELRKLEAAMDRLSPATRRSMNALVKQGYAARVRGRDAPRADGSGESLEANEYGRKDDRPSDAGGPNSLRNRLGTTTSRSSTVNRRGGTGVKPANTLPAGSSSAIRSLRPVSTAPSKKSSGGGGLPSVQSNDL